MTLSAFLLFLLQPMTGRLVLPVLGGAAAVWTTTLVFFQVVLVAGYAWAHFSRALGLRAQVLTQAVLLGGVAWMLPAKLVAIDVPDDATVGALLRLLFLLVGLPAFAVAVNGSLLQRWFAYTGARGAADPAFLYAFSNAGSFLGLVTYPLFLEPSLSVTQQRWLWGTGCGILAVLVALCGRAVWSGADSHSAPLAGDEPIAARRRVEWCLLAMVPASLLAGVTSYASTELFPMPLLWVVPLAIYLLTFITSFGGRVLRIENRRLAMVPMVAVPLIFWHLRGGAPLWASLSVHLLVFGVVAALCHGRLADTRPGPARLTEFYLWIAVAGAAGGSINALIAPAVFTTPAEYGLMIAASAVVLANREHWRGAFKYAFAALILLTAAWLVQTPEPTPGVAMVPLLILLASGSLRPASRAVLASILAVVMMKVMVAGTQGRVLTARSVFAALRVVEDWHPGFRALVHGSTVHGVQAVDRSSAHLLRSYYARRGPLGQVMTAFSPELERSSVGVIGLGAGEMAAYAAEGQRWTFYEIDPEVTRIASDPTLFTYLSDARAEVRVLLGDGRRSIARERDGSPFTLLVLDAFSSDSIPAHLLTLEAFQMYAAKLSPNGIIVVNMSNRFLDLRPVLAGAAEELGFEGWWRFDLGSQVAAEPRYASQWVVMGPAMNVPVEITTSGDWNSFDRLERKVVWTDERATLFDVIR